MSPHVVRLSKLLSHVAFGVVPTGLDLALRGPWLRTLTSGETHAYAVTALLSTALWSCLLWAAGQTEGKTRHLCHGVFALLLGLAVGTQIRIFFRYRAFLDAAAALVGTTLLPTFSMLQAAPRQYSATVGVALAAGILLPLGIRGWRRRWRCRGSTSVEVASGEAARVQKAACSGLLALDATMVCVLISAFASPARGAPQGAMYDVMFLSAVGQVSRARWAHNETVLRVHPGAHTPPALPRVEMPASSQSGRPKRRSVLVILNESVRAESSCIEYRETCRVTPFSNEAAKARIGFSEFRALDSTTAISLGVLLTGRRPTEPRDAILTAPLLWEYAQAAGYRTGYYTSQHLLFGNQGSLIEGVSFSRSLCASELAWNPDLDVGADDGTLVKAALQDLPELGSPFFSVVHLSNTHYPYALDDGDAPFMPQSSETGPYYAEQLKNRYHDVMYHQDRAVAELIVRLQQRGEPVAVIYLSDHGEQLHEHGVHGHTGSVYDAEIRVPLWFLSIAGGLSREESAALNAVHSERFTMLDLAPTLLDLLGIWRHTAFASAHAAIPGESLLRGGSPRERPEVISNCTALWGCSYANWGVLAGHRKLFAERYDRDWKCIDLDIDPQELHPKAPNDGCADLLPIAERYGRPFAMPEPSQ
jgi:hypothetical protein